MIEMNREHRQASAPKIGNRNRANKNFWNGYAELCTTTNFTFLKGASHPEEMITRAAELGLHALAITDTNTLAGVVRAFSALKELERKSGQINIRSHDVVDHSSHLKVTAKHIDVSAARLPRLIVGSRLVLEDTPLEWLALPISRKGYENLSKLLTLGKRRAEKGECQLYFRDIEKGLAQLIFIAIFPDNLDPDNPDDVAHQIGAMAQNYPGHTFLGVAPKYDGEDQLRFREAAKWAHRLSAPMVAIGDILMHHASRRALADVLTCMREHIIIDNIGRKALPNAERRLKSAEEMSQLFRDFPAAIKRSLEIAGRCQFDLSELSYEYPDEITGGESPQNRLERLTQEGLLRRYPDGIPKRAQGLARKELALVGKLGFAAYFLTVRDIVDFARSKGILCQGRGSAANSILCYALGITDVSPEMITMVFERFISEHRGEPPDIDVDFEHERREEVIQHIYEKYGRHRAGLCATVIHFRSRSAIREVGKVMGLSVDITTALSSQIWGWSSRTISDAQIREIGLDPSERRLKQTIWLIQEIIGFPRHLSQHVGGFVITKGRLDALCPIENAAMEDRTIIEWDKDDIDALGILKVDILGLGMLSCIRKAFDLIQAHYKKTYTLANIPQKDEATYDMLCAADAVGVFQVESRAQMNFLPRMRPRNFYDLVIEVAIVRPGPIQGGMVQPYIKRRQGREEVSFPSKELEGVLGKTLGVPLFQEQAMQIAVVAAGFTPEEADKLRRSLATFRRMGTIGEMRERFQSGMLERGYTPEFSASCFSQIEGFADYGFPESHAAAFAMLAYVSAWIKCHYPDVFATALLNAQPMGFYAPAQIVRDARDHHVEVRPVCVNASAWDNCLEISAGEFYALRLGLRQVKGLSQDDAEWIVAARGNGYPDIEALWLRAGVSSKSLEILAAADAFSGMGLNRRRALWEAKAIRAPKPLPLFAGADGEGILERKVSLPTMNLGQEMVEDYVSMRLSLKTHPMELLRPRIPNLTLHSELAKCSARRVSVCGLVITRQRPGTASGVVFLTLEDETGVSNIVIWGKLFERYRRIVMTGRLLRVYGRLEREGIVTHIIAEHIVDLSHFLEALGHPNSDAIGENTAYADTVPKFVTATARHPREQAKRLFPSRDFH